MINIVYCKLPVDSNVLKSFRFIFSILEGLSREVNMY